MLLSLSFPMGAALAAGAPHGSHTAGPQLTGKPYPGVPGSQGQGKEQEEPGPSSAAQAGETCPEPVERERLSSPRGSGSDPGLQCCTPARQSSGPAVPLPKLFPFLAQIGKISSVDPHRALQRVAQKHPGVPCLTHVPKHRVGRV